MADLNRHKRQTLRHIQEHINRTRHRHGLTLEQTGVMEVYSHATDDFGAYNYTTPRRGVAWVPGTDIRAALDQLSKHRVPRLELIEGLFPPAFHHQLETFGLTVRRHALLTYGIISDCDQQAPLIELAAPTPPRIGTFEAADRHAIATWLRLHQRPTDSATIDQCWANVANGTEVYCLACDDYVMAGGLVVSIDPPMAEVRSLYTADVYRQRGIGSALLRSAVTYAQKRGCTSIFVIADDANCARLYRRAGFVDLDVVLVYERTLLAEPLISRAAPPGLSAEPPKNTALDGAPVNGLELKPTGNNTVSEDTVSETVGAGD